MIYGDQVRTILLLGNATSIIFSKKNLGDKLLLVDEKSMSVVGLN